MEIDERRHAAEQTVRALVQRSHRGPEDLTLTTGHRRPVPGPGEYLIRVGAAGVNFADVMQARGAYGGGPRAPYVAGFEAAGEIVGVGPETERPLPVGTHVVGVGPGAFAQYMTMPAAGALPVPSGWSDAEALGLVLNWATALAALKPLGEIATGDVVLVHAAAGGVGQAAVRLARHYGARVIATASPAKHGIVEALGADEVLDGRRPDLAAEITRLTGGVDLVLESVGRATFEVSLSVTKPFTGRVVVFGAASGDATLDTHDLVFAHQVQIKGLHIGALATAAPSLYESLLVELGALIAHGVYPPGTPRIHPLAEGPEVLRQLEAGRTHGKHALDPWRPARGQDAEERSHGSSSVADPARTRTIPARVVLNSRTKQGD
ncbi:zinc-binding dehydrogenase [Streptomyces sp. NPDC058751]|uniref:zinc-binding dehydrogenase n=1 Tax=Streptomyces sp. NPDC058751 TaxID=3346623 RepID=UPI003693B005